MKEKKKIFSCTGNEISPHPKVFFSPDSRDRNDELNESCRKSNIKDSKDQSKISCPYCGQVFEM